ncbi:hypothetical protein BH09PSE5_BH09PSE5_29630 [soil metagenome]
MSDTESISLGSNAENSSTGVGADQWRELVGQIGAEVAGPLSAAMERIHILTGTGRIDRKGLRALRNEVDAARQVGLVSQQISRLASGELSQAPERLQLAPILRSVISQRARDIDSRGIQVRQLLRPADVIVDAPLLFSLLNTMLDWSLANARSHIEFRSDIKSWPANARLSLHFAHAPADRTSDQQEPSLGLDSLIWRLLQQTAASMGLPLSRHVDATHTELVLEFSQTVHEQIDGGATASVPPPASPRIATIDLRAPAPSITTVATSKPLIGSHVLVAASQRNVRLQVREAIRHMGLIVDFVNSMEEAADFCKDGLPHALIFESGLSGPAYDRLKSDLVIEAPDFVFIEIVKDPASTSGHDVPRVSQDAIATSLPQTLTHELSKAM